ncbi:MAG: electron transfer flavoprotein subunit alpha [Ignavibacteriales bacterium]
MKKAIVFLEFRESKIKKSSLEALSTALSFKGDYFNEVHAAVFCDSAPDFSLLDGNFPDLIHVFKNAEFSFYSPQTFKKELSALKGNSSETVFFFSNSALGKDLAPRVAASLTCGLAMDLTEIKLDNGNFIFTRPVFAGKALEDLQIETADKVITLRPNVFPVKNAGASGEPKVVSSEISTPDFSTRTTAVKKAEGKLDVSEAAIIVSGGRGLKGPENYHLIESLADALGGAVGASRAVVDAGWRPHREQVGQTGKTVSPSLYVAVGISGAIQHLAGMSTSKYIVAINKDKDAPIFQTADYGITGDALELLPVFTEEVRKLKG